MRQVFFTQISGANNFLFQISSDCLSNLQQRSLQLLGTAPLAFDGTDGHSRHSCQRNCLGDDNYLTVLLKYLTTIRRF